MAQSKHSAHEPVSGGGYKQRQCLTMVMGGAPSQQGSAIHSSWVTLGKSQALSKPQLPPLYSGTNNSSHLAGH